MTVPEHVGIIMDGNGRWATARGLDRTKGHLEGLKAARRITKAASEAGVKFLSLYVFSTENWKRSAGEVGVPHGSGRASPREGIRFLPRNGASRWSTAATARPCPPR